MVENEKREIDRREREREIEKRRGGRVKGEERPLKMVQHFIFDLNPIRGREREATEK